MKREEFLFSSTRVRMAEKKQLSRSFWERMLEAPDLEQAMRRLGETRYAEQMTSLAFPTDFETVLEKEQRAQADFLHEIAGPSLERFIQLDSIYHNHKVDIKAFVRKKEPSALRMELGSDDFARVRDWLENPSHNPQQTIEEKAVAKACAVYAATGRAEELDRVLDQAVFAERRALAQAIGTPYFENYVAELADFTNVIHWFRARRQNYRQAVFAEVLVQGGRISPEALIACYRAEPAVLLRVVREAQAGSALEKALQKEVEAPNLLRLEQAREARRQALAAEAETILYGPEVVFAYALRIEGEIRNLRILLTAKRAGVSSEALRERISIA